jgi:hypothetical protein
MIMNQLIIEIQFFRDLKILTRLNASAKSSRVLGMNNSPFSFFHPYEGLCSK